MGAVIETERGFISGTIVLSLGREEQGDSVKWFQPFKRRGSSASFCFSDCMGGSVFSTGNLSAWIFLLDFCKQMKQNIPMPTTYPVTYSARLDETEQAIVKRIQVANERPGLAVSQSDAIKLSLHFWADHNPEPSDDKPTA